MGFIIVALGEIDVVRRDQRQPRPIGQIEKLRFNCPLRLKSMPLQLDIQPVAENPDEIVDTYPRERQLPRAMARSTGPFGPPVRQRRPA